MAEESMMLSYEEFLAAKAVVSQPRGFNGPISLNPDLKPHARDIAEWMIRGGNRACFASYGLHKTSIQLQVCESLLDTDPNALALFVCPLGVRREFIAEASARGFSRTPVYAATDEQLSRLIGDGHRLILTNYERVRDGHIDPKRFTVCSLDEASVLRSFGSDTYQTFLPLLLGWTEQCKDGTKMGVGSAEYILLFRKLPTSREKSYADEPVIHTKEAYPRARWQFDAHSFWRSSGNRFLTPDELAALPMDMLRRAWLKYSREKIYDFKEHVGIALEMENRGILPAEFMALEVANPGAANVWDDITRMRTLNGEQARKGWEQHVCPLQLDIVERLIERYSNPGDLVLDMFGGIGTVAQSAVLMGRRGYSIELSSDYHRDGASYCRAAEQKISMPTLFSFLEEPDRESLTKPKIHSHVEDVGARC